MPDASEPYKSSQYWTSHHNWNEDVELPDEIKFHDTTFRDGEQQPGVVFSEDEKVELGKLYSEMGIDRLEPGLPLVSDDDKRAIERLANEGLDADVYAFTRCVKEDVEVAVDCDVDGVVMEVPSSRHLIEHAYDWSYEQALEYAIEATEYAHEQGIDVSFFCIDSSRADPDDLITILSRVKEEGHADSLNVVDTFGALSPAGTRSLVNLVSGEFDIPIEIHVHNDFGLGVANTLAGIQAGAEIAHTTVTGLGERSGNANFEEVATALTALYDYDLNLDLSQVKEIAEVTSDASGVDIHESKPVVGQNQFGIEAGIIAAWWNRLREQEMPLAMYPYHWDLVGQNAPRIAIGKMSGLATIEYWCDRLGLQAPPEDVQEDILQSIKGTSIGEKRELSPEEFVDIYRDTYNPEN
ncbi:LeuA family protein [Natrinema ejinorense]|uniref:Pyruvate carboxyltransferase n=1 Tax=Natrinema ejinorense TaxID=373386 RepID=A0A2A5QQ08_9EURY|nr:pyruvate carboxyltransferase [Natrinema ejinorense]PCR88865.1 pyruvate carboxyltransferase [Natrinema ejinorense]